MSRDIFNKQGLLVTSYAGILNTQMLQFTISDGTDFTQIDKETARELIKALREYVL